MADLLSQITFVDPIATIARSSTEQVRFTIEQNRGRVTIKVREWFLQDGEMRPGRAGISYKPNELDAVLAAFITAKIKTTGGGAL